MPLNEVKSQYPCYWFAKYNENINEIKYNSKIYQLDNNEIYEFDYDGNTTVPFRYLPSDGMTFFGLANTLKNELYLIDLLSGHFNLNGIVVYPSVYYKKDLFFVSNKLEFYGKTGDLIHFKNASAILGGNSIIKDFNIGYKCKIDNLNIQVMLSVNSNDFTPSFYTSFTEN